MRLLQLSPARIGIALWYLMIAYLVVASAVISSVWIGSVHRSWDMPLLQLYLEPLVIHLVADCAVWQTFRSTDLGHRRYIRRSVCAMAAVVATVAALATWERLGHFDLAAGLVMAVICGAGPLMLALFFLDDRQTYPTFEAKNPA
ncbi:hypothetical protein ACFXHA_43240 [Nocardia sp. NPDC059240]|uniref:hypothetical protein n=1 Tax=Nocardia sp. NPDC059240 TaxID=3346786 RepID=UPI0036CA7222